MDFGGVLCVPRTKTNYWAQLPELRLGVNATTGPGASCAGAFLIGSFPGIPCSAYTRQYPIPLDACLHQGSPPGDRNEFEK